MPQNIDDAGKEYFTDQQLEEVENAGYCTDDMTDDELQFVYNNLREERDEKDN
jgi:hypothetical protein